MEKPELRSNGAARSAAPWREVADQVRQAAPKIAALLNAAEADILACMTFSREQRAKIHAPNPLERLNGEIKRRTKLGGNEAAVTRLVGAILLEQNDEDSCYSTTRAPRPNFPRRMRAAGG